MSRLPGQYMYEHPEFAPSPESLLLMQSRIGAIVERELNPSFVSSACRRLKLALRLAHWALPDSFHAACKKLRDLTYRLDELEDRIELLTTETKVEFVMLNGKHTYTAWPADYPSENPTVRKQATFIISGHDTPSYAFAFDIPPVGCSVHYGNGWHRGTVDLTNLSPKMAIVKLKYEIANAAKNAYNHKSHAITLAGAARA